MRAVEKGTKTIDCREELMAFWTDREGKEVSGKEFLSRWKDGISKVTPMQMVKNNLLGYLIVFAGLLWGIVLSGKNHQWWLLTILIGSFIISGSQLTSLIQKYFLLDRIERGMNV